MEASSSLSVLNYGYPHTRSTFNSYLLREDDGNYEIYTPYTWNHICYSFKTGGESRVVLASSRSTIDNNRLKAFGLSVAKAKICIYSQVKSQF
jgi:hypothetical protein